MNHGTFDHIFCLLKIIKNLGNKGTILIIRKLCEYNLFKCNWMSGNNRLFVL